MPPGRRRGVSYRLAPSATLHPSQQAAVAAGRAALAETIEEMVAPEAAVVTVCIASVMLFADCIAAVSTADAVLGLINTILEPRGLEVVQRRG